LYHGRSTPLVGAVFVAVNVSKNVMSIITVATVLLGVFTFLKVFNVI